MVPSSHFVYVLDHKKVLELIGSDTKCLCLFAMHIKSNTIDANALQYIQHISEHFDKVIVLAIDGTPPFDLCGKDNLPANAEICCLPNQCLDFGAYWQILRHLDVSETLCELALVNDSCECLGPLSPIFDWGRGRSFWGVTKSIEIQEHIQSYFVVIEKRDAIQHLLEFVKNNDVAPFVSKTKLELIKAFEVGMSRHMASKFELQAMYSMEQLVSTTRKLKTSSQHQNPSFYCWNALLKLGCPLLKKKRALISY